MFSLQFLLVYFYIVEAYPISFIRTKSDWYKIVHRFVFLVCNCMVIQRKSALYLQRNDVYWGLFSLSLRTYYAWSYDVLLGV